MTKGIVFDIKQGAVHDGPGLRTTVFLKGCPLRCTWCHNPEGLEKSVELMHKENLCCHCKNCEKGCTHEECRGLSRCAKACPTGALTICGREYTPQELCDFLLRDKCFFDASGGGVTFSGGEPLMQSEFLYDCLCILKDNGVHTAIETSGYAEGDVFQRVLSKLDLVIMDIKLMDSTLHKKYTGTDNAKILQNAKTLMQSKKDVVFRTPLVPGVCDRSDNLIAIQNFVEGYTWEQLKYNKLAQVKYEMVGKEFPLLL